MLDLSHYSHCPDVNCEVKKMKGFNPNNGRTMPHSPEFNWLVLGVLCPLESDNELSVPMAISREVV